MQCKNAYIFYCAVFIMEKHFLGRPEKDTYYLSIAKQISRRSTCLRKRFGVIIVKDDVIMSSGYRGAPRGTPNCIDLKKCLREVLHVPSGQHYELCRGVHATTNAIVNAARAGISIVDATMYLFGENLDGSLADTKPCKMCRNLIINAGIAEVVVPWQGRAKHYLIKNWVKESIKNPTKDFRDVE